MLRSWLTALYILWLAVGLLVPVPHLGCTQIERSSLLTFLSHVSALAERPLRWPGGTDDCCLWEGVSCDAGGSVVRLWLPDRGLGGSLPSALQGLGRLVELNLSRNSFGGRLPQFLLWSDHIVVLDLSLNLLVGYLPPPPLPRLENSNRSCTVQFLNLSSNQFQGEFPHLGWLPHLREVDASNNTFWGRIGSPVCGPSSRSIRILDLSNNIFTGSLPAGLGNCSELAVLDVGFNSLSGEIPDDLFAAAQLRRLALPSNRLKGRLRGELISRLLNLVVLDLRSNALEGELPRDLGRLTRLEQLQLGDNGFNGSIPAELLSNCTNLQTLHLGNNFLTGDISALDFSSLSLLCTLDLGGNRFAAHRFPESIYACTSLTAIRLSDCSIRGQLAPGLLRLRSLSYLSLSGNSLEGIGQALYVLRKSKNLKALLLGRNFNGEAMPDGPDVLWEDAFPNLRFLSLCGCGLTGKVPTWISKLGKLEALNLSENQLEGSIPSWLRSLENLIYLDFSRNRLSGEFPVEITEIRALQFDATQTQEDERSLDPLYYVVSRFRASLCLQSNGLSGAIPPEIGRLKRLCKLDLSTNNFSGEIPDNISDLSYLEELNLSRNHLRGPLPKTLIRLTFLTNFSVAENNLSGPVPSNGWFSTFSANSYEGNEYLCGLPLQLSCFPPSSYQGNKNHCGLPLNLSCSPASDEKPAADDIRKWLLIAFSLAVGISAFWATLFIYFCKVRLKK